MYVRCRWQHVKEEHGMEEWNQEWKMEPGMEDGMYLLQHQRANFVTTPTN